MNERIKELETRCWDSQTNRLDAEKFAELIIQDVFECVQYVSRNPNSDMDYEDYIMIQNRIKQRLGFV